jgi:hypothetical protein
MDNEPGSGPAVLAGAAAGIAGLASFLLIHHLWVVPIWFMAPIGAVLAGFGGAAVGASYATLRPALPRRPWTVGAVAAVVTAVLAPAIVVAQLRRPMFSMGAAGTGTLLVPAAEALVDVLVGLFAVAAISGAVIGALVGRSRRAALTTALAGLALAVGPGHNIPFLGGTAAVGTELGILAAVVLVSSAVLVAVEASLSERRTKVSADPMREAWGWSDGRARDPFAASAVKEETRVDE